MLSLRLPWHSNIKTNVGHYIIILYAIARASRAYK